ncbi:DNA 3'-phosphatase [Cooperia oncophora]
MSAEPDETKEQLSVKYYPNLPMFHYLTKMLRFHGLLFDEHVVFRQPKVRTVPLLVLRARRVHYIMKRTAEGKVKDPGVDMFGQSKEKLGTWEGKHSDTILIFTHTDCEPREKVAAFDMDGTLITTKSGKVFPVDNSDWRIMYDKISPHLKKLYNEENFKIVIFTNQKGIQSGKVDKNGFKRKVETIITKLGVPAQAFVSIGEGHYRKPCTGMWKELEEANGEVAIDVSKSLYVGDAAGRHKTKARPKKDHSCADRFFAANVGLKFQTPEEFFLDRDESEPWGPPSFDPVQFFSMNKPLLEPEGESNKQLISLSRNFESLKTCCLPES